MTSHDETTRTVQQHLAAHISYANLADVAAELELDRNRLRAELAGVVEQCAKVADKHAKTRVGFSHMVAANVAADIRALSPVAVKGEAVTVPEGELLWLIETSALAQPNGPKRHFWDGIGWNFSALRAARYPSKDAAERIVEDWNDTHPHRNDLAVCDHLFQCGATPQDAQADAARYRHCLQHGWPSEVGLVHGGNTWRAPDARGLWWSGNTPSEAIDAARAGKREGEGK